MNSNHDSPLAQLPDDVMEYITECIRYPIYPRLEATEAFLTEGRTRFCHTRFSLSAFSKVCKSIRFTAERFLYRDIHVDTVGWTRHESYAETRKHPIWPAGCLRLLLRTLEDRPELGRFVRSVDLRWCELDLCVALNEKLRFLSLCPGLHSLSVSSLPETLIEQLESLKLGISSFAAVTSAGNFPRIIRMFPHLQTLHVHIHGPPTSSSPRIPNHAISGLHMKFVSEGQDQRRLLQLAFAASGPSVRTLYIEGTDTRNQNNFAVAAFPNPTVAMQESVEHLRVKNIDPFRHIYIGQEKIAPLSWMSALRHLHVMRPSHLPPHAFGLIPSNLRSVTFSDYALDSKKSSAESKTSFVASVVDCLEMTTYVKLAGVKTYGAVPDDPWELGDLSSLRLLCRKERVPFMQIGAYADIEPELMIFFK
ncbi:hypothetical protein C8J57DRAFT_1271185 [Mycena rebaudengoi]|nr:hypothetical protein C8J57DRAFT_1271185 [Mycena rebaudengoi]